MSRRPPTTQPRTIALALALFALWAPATVVGSAGTTDLARKAIAEGRLEEARRMLEGRSEGTADDERLELLTQVCTALGDHEAGVRHGKEAVEASPTSSNAHFQYAVALPTKMQRVSRGKAMFLIGTETYKPIKPYKDNRPVAGLPLATTGTVPRGGRRIPTARGRGGPPGRHRRALSAGSQPDSGSLRTGRSDPVPRTVPAAGDRRPPRSALAIPRILQAGDRPRTAEPHGSARAYTRALELDPDNQDAAKALKSLPR